MPICTVKICEVGDPPALGDIAAQYGELKTFIILEKGMVSGAASVAFHFEVDGKNVIVETSAAILKMMHSALEGAEYRFAKKQSNGDT